MAQTIVTITHSESTADMQNLVGKTDSKNLAIALRNYFRALSSGARSATVDLQVAEGAATAATGTFTFTGAGAANDTILINGVTFTAKASGAVGDQWNVGGSASLSAAALAAAINASATALVNKTVTASAVGAVVTITAAKKGAMGNAVTIAKGVDAGSVMTASGARLTGGTNATANTFGLGA